jgi:NAD(P)-dependent dehydrogenase (short-subunit alcohol dehydrogenase family)
MNRFTGKIAVVTGAGSGIAHATARRLASEEATVACVDIDEAAAQKTTGEIVESGGQATAYHCNVADPHNVRDTIAAVASDLGPPNVLCNIAGVGGFAHTTDVTFDEWQRVIAVNLNGTFLMCQAVLPHILDNGGNIVNTASNAGLQGLAYSAAYCASKGGVVQLTRALAIEYWKRGVRVNAVAPGGVDTPLSRGFVMPEGADMDFLTKMMAPLGMAQPDDLASLFAYVASDEARYMTGAIVSMDAGLTT